MTHIYTREFWKGRTCCCECSRNA